MVANIKMADLVLMLRCVHGDNLYTYEQFGVDRKLYVEVAWRCLTAREKKWFPQSHPLEYDIAERFP